jgi:hypothetical protein
MKARAFCLSERGFVRYAARDRRTFSILDAKARAVVIAEVKFREIAVQMLFADMMIGPNHAALENGKIVFGAVDVDETAEPSIFIC